MIATAPRSPIRRSGRPAQTAPSRSLSSITHPFHVSMPPPAGSSPLRRRLILDGEEIPLVLLQGIPHPGEHGDRIGAPSPLTPLLRHGYRHPAPPPRNPSRWRPSPSTSSKAPLIIGLPLLPCLPLRRRPVVAGLRESDPPLRPPLQLRSAAEGADGGGQTDEPRMKGDWEEDCRGGDRSVAGEEPGVYTEERRRLRSCLRLLGPILGLGVGLRGIRPEVHGCRECRSYLARRMASNPEVVLIIGTQKHDPAWKQLPDGPVRRPNQAQVHVLPETVPRWRHPSNKGASCMTQGQCLLLSQGAPITRCPQRSRLQCNRAWIAPLSASR